VDYPTCEFIFTGQRYDAESQIYHYKARFYVPKLGRFGQNDPILSELLNRYQYTLSNSITRTDQLGLVTSQSYEEYWGAWIAARPGFSDDQKERLRTSLADGCIGITRINLGETLLPDDSRCYRDFVSAIMRQKDMIKNKECYCIIGGYNNMGNLSEPKIYGHRFWSNGAKWHINSDGTVDMDEYVRTRLGRPGYINYDYGWYLPDTQQWVYANHAHRPGIPGGEMTVYTGTINEFNRPYAGWDKTVYCVACEDDEHIGILEEHPVDRLNKMNRPAWDRPPGWKHWSEVYHP